MTQLRGKVVISELCATRCVYGAEAKSLDVFAFVNFDFIELNE